MRDGIVLVLMLTVVINDITIIMTTTYLLRDIPVTLWRAAKARAALEGKAMRTVLMDALEAYAGAPAGKTTRKGQKKRT